jgi:hypothetical protein
VVQAGTARSGQGAGCGPGSTRDEIWSVKGPVLLAQRPASQEEGQGEGGEGHHDRRDKQCQQVDNQVRLANPRASVSVSVLVSVHKPAFLLDARRRSPSYA